MSATIKYKGETIATASNNTKTLLTAGKYMEANVVVTDNGGGSPTLQTKSVSYTPTESAVSASVTPDTGYDGLDKVNVSVGAIDPNYVGSEVPVRDSGNITVSDYDEYVTADAGYYPNAVTKYLTPKLKPSPVVSLNTSNGRVTATATYSTSDDTVGYHDSGTATGTLQLITKSARTYTPTTADQTISSGQYLIGNQTILGDADLVAGNIKKDVNIFGVTGTYEGSGASLETKSVTIVPTETAITQTVTPSSGHDGLSQVTVNVGAISSTYVGSEIPRKSSSDLTASGATVTAPSGYYSANATKTIPNAPSPRLTDVDIESNGTATATVEIDDSGYIQGQTLSLSLANAVTVQAAQTITPGTTDQTIPAYRWTTGAQTILGDADLVASNIKKDVSIFGVTGTYEGSGGGLDVNAVAMRTAPSGALVLDTATEVAAYAFYRGQMTSVTSSSVTSLKAYCFAVSNLTSASFYNVTTLEDHIFNYAKAMTATFPKVTNFGTYTFQACYSGAYVIDIGPTLSSFQSTTFYGTDNMTSCVLILRRTAGVVTAPGLDGIPKPLWNANKTGTLYVPQALLASYQTASNWSTAYGTANTTFLPIEGSPYENYYADGTPIS